MGYVSDTRVVAKELTAETIIKDDLLNLDSGTYYPVLLGGGDYNRTHHMEISRGYSENRASGTPNYAYLDIRLRIYAYSWGGSLQAIYIDSYHANYINTCGLVGLRGYYHPVVFLRGGYRYRIRSDAPTTFDVVTSDTQLRNNGDQYDYGIGPISASTMAAHGHYLGMSSITSPTLKSPNVNNLGS